MTSPEIVITALDEARRLIEAGWCQGARMQIRTTGREYDLSGALQEATLQNPGTAFATYLWARSAVIHAIPEKWNYPTAFNDDESTTQADVAEVLKRAAELVLVGEVGEP